MVVIVTGSAEGTVGVGLVVVAVAEVMAMVFGAAMPIVRYHQRTIRTISTVMAVKALNMDHCCVCVCE